MLLVTAMPERARVAIATPTTGELEATVVRLDVPWDPLARPLPVLTRTVTTTMVAVVPAQRLTLIRALWSFHTHSSIREVLQARG